MNDNPFTAVGYLRHRIDGWFVDQDLPTDEYDLALEALDIIREALYANDEMIFKAKERLCQER